jgi:hypothetical protein
MAKIFQDDYLPVSLLADADLSAKQYYCVRAASTADYVATANGGSDPGPIGVQQDDDADTVGDSLSVKTFGFTKAVVAACTVAGAACDIDFGHYLVAGSDGKLYYSSCGLYNARAMEFLASGCAIIHVQWLGSGCAYAAS